MIFFLNKIDSILYNPDNMVIERKLDEKLDTNRVLTTLLNIEHQSEQAVVRILSNLSSMMAIKITNLGR